jgi:hypothetical protein
MTHGAIKKPHNRNLGVVHRLEGAEFRLHYNGKGGGDVILKLWDAAPFGTYYTGECDWQPAQHGARVLNARYRFDVPTQMLEVKVANKIRGTLHIALLQFNLHAEHGCGLLLADSYLPKAPVDPDNPGDGVAINDIRWKVVHWGRHAHHGHGR